MSFHIFVLGFCDFVDRIYRIELDIKYTTDTDSASSYLDLHVKIESHGLLMDVNDLLTCEPSQYLR